MHSQQPPGVVQNWSTLQCSKHDIEQCGYDHAPVTRGRMRTQFPLPHGPMLMVTVTVMRDPPPAGGAAGDPDLRAADFVGDDGWDPPPPLQKQCLFTVMIPMPPWLSFRS